MCGICGFTGRKNEPVLKKMAALLEHRGPDEEGFYSDGFVNLGMRRLSIIDVATGHQPIANEDRTVWTVFNGEIYNFQELRAELSSKGHRFTTDHSDTEVIVHLYEEYGAAFLDRLNGMFAIVVWDSRSRALYLCRDRMGVKPLFYAQFGTELVFASEIKAILAYPGYSRAPDYEALSHYFTFKNIPAPFTAFKGIFSLLPGEYVLFNGGGAVRKRWWKIRFREQQKVEKTEVKEQILSLLTDATRIRLVSDVPIGAYLSGGVDSSSIVALMSRFMDRPVKTFALGYEDELANKDADIYFARKVAQAYKTEHREYIMSHKEVIDDISEVVAAFDQPFSGTISTFFLTKLIKNHVKVALSGDGADELFGSYLSHRVAQPMSHFTRLRDAALAGTLSREEAALLAPCDLPFLKNLYEKSDGEELRWRYSLYLFSDEEKEKLLSGALRDGAGDVRSCELIRGHLGEVTSSDPLNRILELEWNTQLPDQVLAFVDFLSMAHSVEIRSPFLDYRLAEYLATIPGSLKISGGTVKAILKEAVAGLLPDGIVQRPKEGFVLPVFEWMMGKLKEFSVSTLSRTRLAKHGLLNADEVEAILKSYFGGDRSMAGRVWNLIMFQVWWEQYFG